MWTDVVDLRDFYATALGRNAGRMIRRAIRPLWADVTGMSVLGIGYAVPYLRPFQGQADRVMAAMPASQGVLQWPHDQAGLTTLVDECDLPFADLSVDRVLLVHALECAEQVRPMMREIWRVLTGNGRLVVVVPNRRGLWARFDRTPFGHGQPYTTGQLSTLLRDSMFTPLSTGTALYVPPSRSRMVLSSAPALENLGGRIFASFAGVVIAEATKEIYAGHKVAAQRRRTYVPIAHRSHGTQTRG